MSSLLILPQARPACPKDVSFKHAPSLAAYVRTLVEGSCFSEILEADVVFESLEFFGKNSWQLLEDSGLFERSRLETFKHSIVLENGMVGFYPVARLRPTTALALALPVSHSQAELAYLNSELLSDLSANRFKISRQARDSLGPGEISGHRYAGSSSVELLELEVSDGSVLLGWGWVWYHS